ncbi:MAG: peroxiredoxin [Solitalea-like symbiont of Acarus siro]
MSKVNIVNTMSLIGKKAPCFNADTVVNGNEIVSNFSLEQYKDKKYVLFFFYPADFTFVCPTELHAFQEKLNDFEKRNVAVIACSTDSAQSHYAWLNTPKDQGGIQGVKYPIVADVAKTISMAYGVLAGEYVYDEDGALQAEGSMIAYRGLFLIDKQGIVRHQLINDLPLGRSVEEALRTVDALIHFEANGEVCPANWKEGESAMKPTHEGVSKYLTNKK